MPYSTQPYTFDRVVRLIITIAIIAGIIWLINLLKDVLLPFLVACLIAYLFEPFVQYTRTLLRLKGRMLAIFITLFEFTVLFGVVLYFIVPSIIDEMHQMAALMRNYSVSDVSIKYFPPEVHDFLKRHIDFEALAQELLSQNLDKLTHQAMTLIHGGLHVILAIVGWLIVFLYVIFIMLDYDRLMLGFRLMVPPGMRKTAYKIGNDIKTSMNHYFRGQALISCCVAVIYCGGFALAGLPMAFVLGIGTAILFMVPYCQYISLIPVTLLCMVDAANGTSEFWPMWWECIATFAAVQVVGDLVLTPRIMGKAMGLNPAIILLSLSIWGTLLGFIGMIIALPMTTLLLSYYEQYVILNSKNGETPAQRKKEAAELEEIAQNPFEK